MRHDLTVVARLDVNIVAGPHLGMEHGAVYNLLRISSVMGGYSTVNMFVSTPGITFAQKTVAMPITLMTVVLLLHASSMFASSRLDSCACLRFVERIVYYATTQAVLLLILTHALLDEKTQETWGMNTPGVTGLYMLFDLGHHIREWATPDCTLLPQWLIAALTWAHFMVCVYIHGDAGKARDQLPAILLADIIFLIFAGVAAVPLFKFKVYNLAINKRD